MINFKLQLRNALINVLPPQGSYEMQFAWQCGYDKAAEIALDIISKAQAEIDKESTELYEEIAFLNSRLPT